MMAVNREINKLFSSCFASADSKIGFALYSFCAVVLQLHLVAVTVVCSLGLGARSLTVFVKLALE